MRTAYYWLFYALYRIDPFRSERADREWKTVAFITLIEFWAVSSALFCVGLLSKSGFAFRIPKSGVVVAGLALFGLNYAVTLRNGAWRRHARQFEALPSDRRRRGVIVGWIAAAIAAGAFLATSYAYHKGPIGVAARQRAIEARENAR